MYILYIIYICNIYIYIYSSLGCCSFPFCVNCTEYTIFVSIELSFLMLFDQQS